MSDRVRVYIGHRNNSVEGHIKQCLLLFNGQPIWGVPNMVHCHENTEEIKRALERADPRFLLVIADRNRSIEGHRATITIRKGQHVYLNNMQTHENMSGLQFAVDDALDRAGTTFGAGGEDPALDAEEKNTAKVCVAHISIFSLRPHCSPTLLLQIKSRFSTAISVPSAVSSHTHTPFRVVHQCTTHILTTSNPPYLNPSKANLCSRNDEYICSFHQILIFWTPFPVSEISPFDALQNQL